MKKKSNRKKIKQHSQFNFLKDAGLIKAIGNEDRVRWGLMTPHDEKAYITSQFSNRTDYGRTIDIRIPQGFHAQVKKVWEMYGTDRLFRYLIDRATDFGANGFEWEIPMESVWKDTDENKTIKKIKGSDKEKKVWNKWAATLNTGVANVLPGVDEVNKWFFKHLLLNAMVPIEWEWGKINVEGITYDFPTKMTIYNSLSTVLQHPSVGFGNEKTYIRTSIHKKNRSSNDTSAQVTTYSTPTKSDEWHEIKSIGNKNGKKNSAEGFVLKYNWAPGDNTTLFSGKTASVGQGLYPSPPFLGLFEILMLRRALAASDLAILDGVINYVIDWEIGDNTMDKEGYMPNQPRPEKKDENGTVIEKSTIELVKEMITQDTRSNVMQLFHPYYIKLNIKTPDVTSLVSAEKYIQSIVEIFLAFGIFLSPTDRRVNFTDINVANFEQMLDNIRMNHIRRFWETLCAEIVKRNGNKLKIIPNMSFNPLNTQNAAFRSGLLEIVKIGKLSAEALLQAYKRDKNTELGRIVKETISGEKEIMDRNVPVSYKQTFTDPSGDVKKSDRPATNEGGRPKKTEDEKKEKEKKDGNAGGE